MNNWLGLASSASGGCFFLPNLMSFFHTNSVILTTGGFGTKYDRQDRKISIFKMEKLTEVTSYDEFLKALPSGDKAYLLLYKEGSENSNCAYENLMQIREQADNIKILAANVSKVRDIHPRFGVTSAPTMLEFVQGKYNKTIKGCHEPDFYKSVFENNIFKATKSDEGKKQKRVVVYSTPSCPHCNTLKSHLRRHNIQFKDIDVSKDQQKAQELVQKTGQQGVPQTDINGQFITGFNKAKINELLGIQG